MYSASCLGGISVFDDEMNAGLARTPCHQFSWVQRSAFLKYEDLIELTPSP